MRIAAAFILAALPVTAMAQSSLQTQLDSVSASIQDSVVKMRGQIMTDQTQIATLTQQNADMNKKNDEQTKTIDNLQKQLKAATEVKPSPTAPTP
jgi:septal ring factor EnvC (AmiA/AmiB activator)